MFLDSFSPGKILRKKSDNFSQTMNGSVCFEDILRSFLRYNISVGIGHLSELDMGSYFLSTEHNIHKNLDSLDFVNNSFCSLKTSDVKDVTIVSLLQVKIFVYSRHKINLPESRSPKAFLVLFYNEAYINDFSFVRKRIAGVWKAFP